MKPIPKFKSDPPELCPSCNEPYAKHTCYVNVACCGESSMHKTLVESEEWGLWEKENSRRMHTDNEKCFDTDECRECGYMSPAHWKEFIGFIKTLPNDL